MHPEQPTPTGHDENAASSVPPAAGTYTPETAAGVKRSVRIVVAVLAVGFVAIKGLHLWHEHRLAKETEAASSTPPLVDVVVARPAGGDHGLSLPGETAAWFESTIYARVNGYVARWIADIGDHVHKGQTLALIDTPELDAELGAARAELKAAEAQEVARKAESEFARSTNERWRDSPKGVVSDQERDAKRADFEAADARLYAARAQVALDQAKVAQYQALTEFKSVTAPYDGTITERRIDVGNLVTAGSTSATTSLYRMSQADPLRVYVDVPQSLAADLMKAGVPARIEAPAVKGGVISGKIVRSAQALNAQARTMRVEVDIPNSDSALVPGMYVTVDFALPARGAAEVPAAALIFRAGKVQVARVDKDGHVGFADVVIARDDGSVVELASGVTPGDRLVLNISSQIAAGQAVTAHEAEPAARRP